jgi:hypothetical protein
MDEDEYDLDDEMLNNMVKAAEYAEQAALSTNQPKLSTNQHKLSTNQTKLSTNQHKLSTNQTKLPTNHPKLSTNQPPKNKQINHLKNDNIDPKQKTMWDYGSNYVIGTKKIETPNLNPFALPPKSVIVSDHEYNYEALENWIYPTNYPERECLFILSQLPVQHCASCIDKKHFRSSPV